jgi:predicted  nucleic acid-binding Zn-ribbon protein
VKATESQQDSILALGQLDLSISRVRAAISELESGESTATLRANLYATSSRLIDARNTLERLKTEQARADSDLQTVEQRIDKDAEKLHSSSSSRDISAFEMELKSLRRRKSDLEDASLAILEQLEAARAIFEAIQSEQSAIEESIRTQESADHTQIQKMQSQLALDLASRADLVPRVGAELYEAYEKRSKKGIAVGRLIGRECGACRMSLTVTDFNAVTSLPSNEIPSCPECQAFLVRAR